MSERQDLIDEAVRRAYARGDLNVEIKAVVYWPPAGSRRYDGKGRLIADPSPPAGLAPGPLVLSARTVAAIRAEFGRIAIAT